MANQEYIAPSEITNAAKNDNPTNNVVSDMMKNTPTEVANTIKQMSGDSGKGTSSLPNFSLVEPSKGQNAGGDLHSGGASAGCTAGDGHSSSGAGGVAGGDRAPGGGGSAGGDLNHQRHQGSGHKPSTDAADAKPVATPYALTSPNALITHH